VDRVIALNNRLSIYRPDGSAEQRVIETPDDLSSTLRNNFNINLPQACEKVLARAVWPQNRAAERPWSSGPSRQNTISRVVDQPGSTHSP
jgi:hypothetical protein